MEPSIQERFDQLLNALREKKPNDRSEADRYWAISITEAEKAKAIFMQYAGTGSKE